MPKLDTPMRRRHAATMFTLLLIALLIPVLSPTDTLPYALTIAMIVLIVIAAQLIYRYVENWIGS